MLLFKWMSKETILLINNYDHYKSSVEVFRGLLS